MSIFKRNYTLKIMAILLVFFLHGNQSLGQDMHFSQVGNSPLNISPALTGVFSGDSRFVGNFKSQWQSVPVNFMTFAGAYERKFLHKNMPNSQFGGGLLFNYDQAGDGDLSLSQLGLNIGYTHRLSERNFLSGGFQISGNQRMFKPEQLTFDDQFDGEIFNSAIVSQEAFDDPSFLFMNFSVGLNWHYQNPAKRTRLDFGGSIYNLNGTRQSFFNENESELSKRIHVHGLGSFMIAEKVDMTFQGLMSWQVPYSESVLESDLNII
jgi:type IX secretion system PorP/SprF family membrane protein